MADRKFKDTEVGRIPVDWEVKRLGELGVTYSGLSGKKKEDFNNGNSYYITFLNVLNNPVIDLKQVEKVRVSKWENQNLVRKGDIFFNTSSETPEEVGMCSVLMEDKPNLYLNSFCFGYRLYDGSKCDALYLTSYLRSDLGRKMFSTIAQGSTRYNLSKKEFNNIAIPLPPLPEQKAIARVLSDIDELIESIEKLIHKKKQIKQGAMQELLTGKKRLPGFSGKWEVKRLGEIADIRTGKKNNEDKVTDGKYPFFVRSQNVEKINSYSYDGEAILVPGEGGIGEIYHYINGKFDYHQRVYKISDFPEDVNCKFVYYYMMQNFKEHALKRTVKATVDSLRLPTFEAFELLLPPLPEQKAIAQILSDMDAEIEALEKKLDKYKKIKEGMMEKLLTGQVRLV